MLGTRRTSELKRDMPRITQKMLTQQLGELEEDGIIIRKVYEEVLPMVEYSLSEYGSGLKDILKSLCLWGEVHITKKFGDKNEVLEESMLKN